ncbi:MAG: DUF4160 domain-containing protein [Betaproteobacteria bacterium]|nr:DUF4160 domain-containing protein [Betaproteobacteria bacterium]
MPVVFRHNGIRFLFYSNEGNPREPLHIHAQRGECLAKIWLHPTPSIADSFGFSPAEMRMIIGQVSLHAPEIERSWNEHFG